jgi:hypothetical protein
LVHTAFTVPHRPVAGDEGDVMRERIRAVRLVPSDQGTTTAEYAIVTMAAVAFAGLLIKVVTSGAVNDMLTGLVHRALSV